MCNKIYLDEEFDKIWNKINNNENFVLFRYGDGERAVMTGRSVTAQEGWVSPDGISNFGLRLLDTLKHKENNVYYGISCPCCDSAAYYWYSTRIDNKNKTFANIFVNANYQNFIEKFAKLEKNAIFIGNYRAKDKAIGNLNVLNRYFIDDDCFSFYENKYSEFINKIKNEYGSKNDILYVVSAGPLSEIIISDLYKNNPNNCYIDFGSSIDKYIHEKQTRPYMDKNTVYAKQKCVMDNFENMDFDVTVVLSAYKRIENLELQLDAIENQTLRPKEIILFQDGVNGDEKVEIPEKIKNRFNVVEISKENKGVWARFDFARDAAKSKYVCIFDDDTIPGNRWLENCFIQMQQREGLYGTIGILCNCKKYCNQSFKRIGWANPNKKTLMVDFVGHAWFLKTEWLNYLFENTEELQAYKICGEDMTLSFKLQTHGIGTFVPPHPQNKIDLWGSLPDYSTKFGDDKNSLFKNNGWTKMSEAFDLLIKKYNFKILKYSNVKEYRKSSKVDKKPLLKRIFSISKEYNGDNKRKVITILGIKIKIKKVNLISKIKYKKHLKISKYNELLFPVFDSYDVSIVIPVHNQYEYTVQCLNSIYQNTKNVNYEVIIVDDCSSDETVNISQKFKNINVLRNENNLGFVLSCNKGAASAKGKYIYLLNNDTVVLKDCVWHLMNTYTKDSMIGISGSKIIDPKTFNLQSIGAEIKSNGQSKSIGFNKNPLSKKYNIFSDRQYLCGASIMVSKELWEKLGGFDEIYSPGYYEEADLCFKARDAGYRVVYQPLSEIFHFGSISFGKRTDLNAIYKKNKETFLSRWANFISKER